MTTGSGLPWPEKEKSSHTKWSEYKRKRSMGKHAMQGQLQIGVGDKIGGTDSVSWELNRVPFGAKVTALTLTTEGTVVVYWSKDA